MRRILIPLVLLGLAAALRFYRLDYQSYWNDEGNTRVMAGRSAGEILRAAAADIHPPGYYLLLKFWGALAGETEFALRSFSALAGVALTALLYRLGREWFGRGAGRWAALFGAVNPFLVYYSQEARMYALLAAWSAGSFLFMHLWLERRDVGSTLGYCLTTTLGLYTHYAFGLVVLAQNLAMVVELMAGRFARWRPLGLRWAALQAAVLLSFSSWLPIAYRQLTSWPAERAVRPFPEAIVETARYLALGRTAAAGWITPAALAAFGALVAAGLWRSRSWPAAFWLLVPAGLTAGLGLLSEAFAKFLLAAVPVVCLLAGSGLAGELGAPDRRRIAHQTVSGGRVALLRIWPWGRRIFVLAALIIVTCGTYSSLNALYFDPAYFRDDYRGIARYVRSIERPGDAIITIAPNQIEAFGYYYRAAAPIFPLPSTRPLDRAETEAALKDITAAHARLFVLYWGEAQADPEHFVEDWLNANTFKAGDRWFGQVRLATYACAAPAAAPAVLSGARFGRPPGDRLILAGYTLRSARLMAGDILQVTFFWYADSTPARRYKVFVHLYANPEQPPSAQHDGEPGGGQLLTTGWEPGQVYADNHGVLLPPDLPPGEYRLLAGVYALDGGERLPVTGMAAVAGDRLDLGTLTIE